MILSRSNLLAAQGASKDSPILNNLHVTWDGSTVAFDGRALLCVSPVTAEMEDKVTLRDTGRTSTDQGVTVSTETVKEVLKNLPVDKKFNGAREHVDLSPEGLFTIDDGKREKTFKAKVYPRKFVDYKKVLTDAKKAPIAARVVLNGKRLRNLLDMLDKICPDSSGESPVFLEFTEDNDVVIRAVNPLNSQRAIAYMTSYKGEEGQWLTEDEWEKTLSNGGQTSNTIQSGISNVSVNNSSQALTGGISEAPMKKSAARKINNEWRQ